MIFGIIAVIVAVLNGQGGFYEAVKKSGVTPDMSAEDMCDKLCEAMTQIKIDGLTGAGNALAWNEKGEVSKSPMAVVIKDGVYVGK